MVGGWMIWLAGGSGDLSSCGTLRPPGLSVSHHTLVLDSFHLEFRNSPFYDNFQLYMYKFQLSF